ncbi:MFS transporter [Hydrogenimonas thermophila]|uniref:Predicted arabinose efflux permease, MFS family n=1 Tax=Hydrogenimonas thermophila TaxID=223786 RepID=A0A1I5S144_9BACT|nr:Predicted arabinose efflux permease, MFS family [Hydrogenimonas thermophila]
MKEIFKKVLPLSLIVALRFFGLFIVLSVLSQYALELPGGTALLAGIAVGGYALTQAVLQVPFGVLSDKIGRKKTLLIGLLIFAAGSAISAIADNIYILLLGRFLQGAGAIGSVVTAMIADHVREDQRAHAMAVMGMTIAMSFAAAMIIGPIIGGLYSVSVLFWITAILAILALTILFTAVPEPPKIIHSYSEEEAKIKHVFKDKDLVRMYITFLFHSSTMAIAFFLIPIIMKQKFGLGAESYWKIYLPAVFFGIIAMGPAAVFGEKYGKGKEVFLASIAFIAAAFILMGWSDSILWFGVGATFFFIGFNMFEPLLQSFVSKFAKVHQKGAALGVANTFAYVGIFLGGAIGGWLYQHFGSGGVATFVLVVSVFWAAWIFTMRSPGVRDNLFLPFTEYDKNKINGLKMVNGVTDFYLNETEQIIVVKFDNEIVSSDVIETFLKK